MQLSSSKKIIIKIFCFFVVACMLLIILYAYKANRYIANKEDFVSVYDIYDDIKVDTSKNNVSDTVDIYHKEIELKEDSNLNTKIFENGIVGYLTIEKIGLFDEIVKEGVSLDVINYNIGHFTNTSVFNGNIGLAAHNGGVEGASFFKELYTLKQGDKIIYETKYNKRTYEVKEKITIDSYDWSYLKEEDKNVLTLITCITGQRNKRLCVRAVELL